MPAIKELKATEAHEPETSKVGKRGTVVIPAKIRRRLGIKEGSHVVAEVRDGGIYIRPVVVVPVDSYTPERKAQFLLSGATNAKEYARALREVRRMGLDPKKIPHYKPAGA